MFKYNYWYITLLFLFAFPFMFLSCTGEEACSEYDTYGSTIIKQTDTIYKKTEKLHAGPYFVQVGAFVNKSNADAFANDARSKLKTKVDVKMTPEGLYRILIGEFKEIETAQNIMKSAKNAGFPDAFVRDEYGPVLK